MKERQDKIPSFVLTIVSYCLSSQKACIKDYSIIRDQDKVEEGT